MRLTESLNSTKKSSGLIVIEQVIEEVVGLKINSNKDDFIAKRFHLEYQLELQHLIWLVLQFMQLL